MNSKIVPSFGRIGFFTRICSSVFSLYLGDQIIRKEKGLKGPLFAILSIIPFFCNPTGSFLRTSSVKTEALAIFESLILKVKTCRDIFFSSLLLAIYIFLYPILKK